MDIFLGLVIVLESFYTMIKENTQWNLEIPLYSFLMFLVLTLRI